MKKYAYEDILKMLPQQPPFMFVESAEVDGDTATGSYTIKGDEEFLKGHFPNDPVFPASIMLEGLGQLAIVYLLSLDEIADGAKAAKNRVYFTATDGVRCSRICRAGDRLDYKIKIKRLRFPLGIFEGRIEVCAQPAVVVEKISITFDIEHEEK